MKKLIIDNEYEYEKDILLKTPADNNIEGFNRNSAIVDGLISRIIDPDFARQ